MAVRSTAAFGSGSEVADVPSAVKRLKALLQAM
jgi:hypothetical protein